MRFVRPFAICALGAIAAPAAAQSNARSQLLWYDAPATQWVEALPVGNGRLGAMVFGGVARERIQFNEATIWTGGPRSYARPGASRYLKRLRELLYAGRQAEAEALAQVHFMSAPLRQRAYQAFGDLRFEFPTVDSTRIEGYRRELDLDSAVATTRFRVDGVTYVRQVFASHPDGVVAMRLSADRPGRLSFTVKPTSAHRWHHRKAIGGDQISMQGIVEDGVIEFEARLLVRAEGGETVFTDSSATVRGATSATVLLAGATNFVSYADVSADPIARNDSAMRARAKQAIRRHARRARGGSSGAVPTRVASSSGLPERPTCRPTGACFERNGSRIRGSTRCSSTTDATC